MGSTVYFDLVNEDSIYIKKVIIYQCMKTLIKLPSNAHLIHKNIVILYAYNSIFSSV